MKLLLDLARKIGINARILSGSEIEDNGLVNAIQQVERNEFIDNEDYLKKLRR